MREGDGEVVEIADERDPLADATLALITRAIGDVQPVGDLLSELEERRRGLKSGGEPHLFVLVEDGEPLAAAAGIYLEMVNAGFVTYLAVHENARGRLLGRTLRAHLVAAFKADARARGRELAWTVGEVRRESPWLRTLVNDGTAIPFDFSYFHPWQSREAEGRYVLYREPAADTRVELPSEEVLNLVHAIWRRSYRIRFPLQSATFNYMLEQVESRALIGADPAFQEVAEV
ncbi:MAG TPA: GNAT family N-acetyltransferase [Longimicrobium sp.]|nr:GNAT family N-acetyltransferase [Longimicrobium sp.]